MAHCTNCAILRERVRELERDIGLRMRDNGVTTLRRELGLQPMSARAVLILYQANGRFVPTDTLIALVGCSDDNNLRTRLSLARRTLGPDFILSSWGAGYRLSPEAMARVARLLEPASRGEPVGALPDDGK